MKNFSIYGLFLSVLVIAGCSQENINSFDKEVLITADLTLEDPEYGFRTFDSESAMIADMDARCSTYTINNSSDINLLANNEALNYNEPSGGTHLGYIGWVLKSNDITDFKVTLQAYEEFGNGEVLGTYIVEATSEEFFIGAKSNRYLWVLVEPLEEDATYKMVRRMYAYTDFCDFTEVDSETDSDNDGIEDTLDNCPLEANSDQADYDGDNIGDICDEDDDNDGVLDENDAVQFSNNESTVMIDGCNSSVENISLEDGYTLSDRIDELESSEYRNHGQYVRATSQFLKELVKEGVITEEEKDLINGCAGNSNY